MSIQPNTIVRINDYCIAELSSEQLSMSTSPSFMKIYNSETGTHHIFNSNGSATGNNQDYSATYVSSNKYVYLDQDVTVPYWSQYPEKFKFTAPGAYDTFNRIRFYFTSGYDFSAIPGLILGVKNKMNNGGYTFFTQILVTPEWYVDLVKNSPSPIYLADSMFDKYIDVLIPDISQINLDYYAQPANNRSGEFGALITNNGINYTGFVSEAPIIVTIEECNRIDRQSINGDIYDIYNTDGHYESVMAMDSIHQRFGAYIGESAEFDAIEFYGTMLDANGNLAFAEELINLLSTNIHDSWVIAHQLTIQEWVDGVQVNTAKHVVLQESEFDSPIYYRPILKNSGTALAFEIEYTCRLYNRRNGDQIIRLASFISYSAAKYGRSLSRIQIADTPQSHVVYNKIIKSSLEATDLFVEQNYTSTGNTITSSMVASTPRQVTSFIPMFYNVNAISVSQKDVLPDSDEIDTTLVYKQGDMRFILNPFDNLFKFKVHTTNYKGLLIPMDLSGYGSFYMVLMNNNKKTKFPYLSDSGYSSPKVGELMFKIPQKEAETLITSSTREFYITLLSTDGTETVLYNGFWNDVTEKDIVDANNDRVTQMQEQIKNNAVASTASTASTTSVQSTFDVSTASQQSAISVSQLQITPTTRFVDQRVEMNIPGYIAQGVKFNDVSVVMSIPPKSSTTVTDKSKSIAASALAASLGKQAGLVADAGESPSSNGQYQ